MSRGSRAMGFVIQMLPARRRATLVPGVLESPDNAAGGHLGAKTAVVIHGTWPSVGGVRPVVLPPNVIDHFYLGGERLAALRGVPLPSPRRPEEWLAATVHRSGEPDVGRSRLA